MFGAENCSTGEENRIVPEPREHVEGQNYDHNSNKPNLLQKFKKIAFQIFTLGPR